MNTRWQDPEVREGRRQESEQRRRAFEEFMQAHKLKASTWARAAGLPNANAIYAYRNGTTDFLSQSTINALVSAVPGATVAELLGETPKAMPIRILPVVAEARAGAWQKDVRTRVLREMEYPIPGDMHADELIKLVDDHADRVYPHPSYLAVQKMQSLQRELRFGDRVIVHGVGKQGHEITCRELAGTPEAPELVFVTDSRPALREQRLAVPTWPYDGRFWEQGGVRYTIEGRVIMMMLFEEPRHS